MEKERSTHTVVAVVAIVAIVVMALGSLFLSKWFTYQKDTLTVIQNRKNVCERIV